MHWFWKHFQTSNWADWSRFTCHFSRRTSRGFGNSQVSLCTNLITLLFLFQSSEFEDGAEVEQLITTDEPFSIRSCVLSALTCLATQKSFFLIFYCHTISLLLSFFLRQQDLQQNSGGGKLSGFLWSDVLTEHVDNPLTLKMQGNSRLANFFLYFPPKSDAIY
jgi:hypothetical protein